MESHFNIPSVMNLYKQEAIAKLEMVGKFVASEARINARNNFEKKGMSSGYLMDHILHEVIPERLVTRITSHAEYGAIQELGGVTHPTVTEQMRKWAWAKFYETGEEKYKGLALTKKEKLDITIEAQPYLRPAVYENADKIKKIMAL